MDSALPAVKDSPPLFHEAKQSVGAGKNEKQSQLADLRPETRNSKSEIRRYIECSVFPQNDLWQGNFWLKNQAADLKNNQGYNVCKGGQAEELEYRPSP